MSLTPAVVNSRLLRQVAVSDSLQHAVGLVFFSSGLYKVELRCTAATGDIWTQTQALEVV